MLLEIKQTKLNFYIMKRKTTEEARYVILFDFVLTFARFYMFYFRTGTFASRERMQANSDRIE